MAERGVREVSDYPVEGPYRKPISIGWKVFGALVITGLTIMTMIASLANSGMNYRQMKAIEKMAERCGK